LRSNSSGDVRAAAIESLGPNPEEWTADLIGEAYETGDPLLQLAALRAMGYSGDERWEEYVSEQLASGEAEMRFEAVLAAANLGSEELVPALGDLLADEEPEVVLAVVEALGEIGGEEAHDLLLAFREHVPAGMEESLDIAIETAAGGGLFRRFGELSEE
jgi:HEAT repeat protein